MSENISCSLPTLNLLFNLIIPTLYQSFVKENGQLEQNHLRTDDQHSRGNTRKLDTTAIKENEKIPERQSHENCFS